MINAGRILFKELRAAAARFIHLIRIRNGNAFLASSAWSFRRHLRCPLADVFAIEFHDAGVVRMLAVLLLGEPSTLSREAR